MFSLAHVTQAGLSVDDRESRVVVNITFRTAGIGVTFPSAFTAAFSPLYFSKGSYLKSSLGVINSNTLH